MNISSIPEFDSIRRLRTTLLHCLQELAKTQIWTLLAPQETKDTSIMRHQTERGRVQSTVTVPTTPTCCKGRMSLLSRLLSGRVILDAVISYSSARTEILYGVTQSLMPNTLAWTTPFVIIGLKYKLSCTLAIFYINLSYGERKTNSVVHWINIGQTQWNC